MDDTLETLFSEMAARRNPSGMLTIPDELRCLDTNGLGHFEAAVRAWAGSAGRASVVASRRRMLAIFLLLRHTGARLGEVLGLRCDGLQVERGVVLLGNPVREVQVVREVLEEIVRLLADSGHAGGGSSAAVDCVQHLAVDPGHVRRKFYECAQAAGLGREMGTPSVLRRSRAVELLRSGLPLPVVQRMLGHGNADLTAAYVAVPDDAMRRMVGQTLAREQRRSSARNAFFGRVEEVRSGDVQALVRLQTPGGLAVCAIITSDSLEMLSLAPGGYVTAEVKAPWVLLHVGDSRPVSSAGNVFAGSVVRCRYGAVTAEAVVRLDEGTEVCSVLAADMAHELALEAGRRVWVVINALSVILDVA